MFVTFLCCPMLSYVVLFFLVRLVLVIKKEINGSLESLKENNSANSQLDSKFRLQMQLFIVFAFCR